MITPNYRKLISSVRKLSEIEIKHNDNIQIVIGYRGPLDKRYNTIEVFNVNDGSCKEVTYDDNYPQDLTTQSMKDYDLYIMISFNGDEFTIKHSTLNIHKFRDLSVIEKIDLFADILFQRMMKLINVISIDGIVYNIDNVVETNKKTHIDTRNIKKIVKLKASMLDFNIVGYHNITNFDSCVNVIGRAISLHTKHKIAYVYGTNK